MRGWLRALFRTLEALGYEATVTDPKPITRIERGTATHDTAPSQTQIRHGAAVVVVELRERRSASDRNEVPVLEFMITNGEPGVGRTPRADLRSRPLESQVGEIALDIMLNAEVKEAKASMVKARRERREARAAGGGTQVVGHARGVVSLRVCLPFNVFALLVRAPCHSSGQRVDRVGRLPQLVHERGCASAGDRSVERGSSASDRTSIVVEKGRLAPVLRLGHESFHLGLAFALALFLLPLRLLSCLRRSLVLLDSLSGPALFGGELLDRW
jgi:hypothetical protein